MSEEIPQEKSRGSIEMTFPGAATQHVGQATAIEQSRAVAEVQACVFLAKQFPRNQRLAIGRIESACQRLGLAEEAFYSFPRAGKTVTGATIKLAKALALCWGGLRYDVAEMAIDFQRGETEMMAYAWDLEANVFVSKKFLVQHYVMTRDGKKILSDPRDIYEKGANEGARRLRECIFSVIPPDVVARAEEVCRETLKKGDGKPLNHRIHACIAAFVKIGVSREMMANHLGATPDLMTLEQLLDLEIIYQSIKNGEPAKSFFMASADAEASARAVMHMAQKTLGDHGNGVEPDARQEVPAVQKEAGYARKRISRDEMEKKFANGMEIVHWGPLQGTEEEKAAAQKLREQLYALAERLGPAFVEQYLDRQGQEAAKRDEAAKLALQACDVNAVPQEDDTTEAAPPPPKARRTAFP